MNELEKWRLESCCAGACEFTTSCIECKQLKAIGWRAALRWAMTLANCGGEIAHYELEEELKSD